MLPELCYRQMHQSDATDVGECVVSTANCKARYGLDVLPNASPLAATISRRSAG